MEKEEKGKERVGGPEEEEFKCSGEIGLTSAICFANRKIKGEVVDDFDLNGHEFSKHLIDKIT